MLATLGGFLALLLGLLLLLLPLLLTELSRPRDSVWGAVVLLLGLVLVTSAERLTGAPMLAVLCGGLLVGRLGGEVAQGRWRALTDEERLALRSTERWSRSLNQLAAIAASLLQSVVVAASGLLAWLTPRPQGRSHGKRWVRSDSAPEAGAGVAADEAAAAATPNQPVHAAAPAAASEPAAPSDPSLPAAITAADTAPVTTTTTADLTTAPQEAAASPSPPPAGEAAPNARSPEAPLEPSAPGSSAAVDPDVRVVADLAAVDALLAAAAEPETGIEPAVMPPAPEADA